jgi:hypothetical protein
VAIPFDGSRGNSMTVAGESGWLGAADLDPLGGGPLDAWDGLVGTCVAEEHVARTNMSTGVPDARRACGMLLN